jgi:hypothetical protein
VGGTEQREGGGGEGKERPEVCETGDGSVEAREVSLFVLELRKAKESRRTNVWRAVEQNHRSFVPDVRQSPHSVVVSTQHNAHAPVVVELIAEGEGEFEGV